MNTDNILTKRAMPSHLLTASAVVATNATTALAGHVAGQHQQFWAPVGPRHC